MYIKEEQFENISLASVLQNIEFMPEIHTGLTLLDSTEFDRDNDTTYVCIYPKHVYETRGNDVYIDDLLIGQGKPLLYEKMRMLLKQYGQETKISGFVGGFVGYVSYEATPLFIDVPVQADGAVPLLSFRFYTQVLKIQNKEAILYLLEGEKYSEWERVLQLQETDLKVVPPFSDQMQDEQGYVSSLTERDFINRVEKTKEAIEYGNVYQLNLTRRLRQKMHITPDFLLRYYHEVQSRNKAPYSVLWLSETEKMQFASSSPEQFFSLRSGVVTTKPIKGTRPRKRDINKDNEMRSELAASEKDHAELLMITDLLRNDLNQVVENNSVEVVKFAEICENPTVFHLVSTIQATLPKTKDALDILDGLFPGGSITGAPKKAAVAYIDKLETCSRGLYTGSCGYISVNQDADFNILIRTLFQKHGTIDIHVGGGIVYESVPKLEYLETKQKAKALLTIVEEVK